MSDTRTYFAKVVEGVVVEMRVVAWDFLVANSQKYGDSANWKQTFIGVEGKTYAGIGYTYDAVLDEFVAPPTPVAPPLSE